MSNRERFGKASVGGSGTRTRNFRITEGANVYRIAPAYGTLAASGKWFRFVKQHWGYKSAPTDQSPNGFPRLFLCPQEIDYKSKMVLRACPECDDLTNLQANYDNKLQRFKEAGKTEHEIETVLGAQRQYLKDHNLDKKYIVLAKNENGEWGVLWIPFKAKEALDNRRKQVLEDEGFDILDADQGAWVKFVRTGTGRTTAHSCDVVYETVTLDNGKKAKQPKQEALTDADFDSIVAECPDLSTVGRPLTQEQIARLVESRGDPEIVDGVFNENREASPSPSPVKAEAKPAPRMQARVEPKVEAKPAPAPAPAAVDETDEEAVLKAQLAAIQAKKAAALDKKVMERAAHLVSAAAAIDLDKAGVIDTAPTTSNEPAGDPDNMSDDEFMRAYGKRQ